MRFLSGALIDLSGRFMTAETVSARTSLDTWSLHEPTSALSSFSDRFGHRFGFFGQRTLNAGLLENYQGTLTVLLTSNTLDWLATLRARIGWPALL